jgi:hypothetical protein
MAERITRDDAWRLLGADPLYTPTRPNYAATPPQLVALNLRGQLVAHALPEGAESPEESTRRRDRVNASDLQKQDAPGGAPCDSDELES